VDVTPVTGVLPLQELAVTTIGAPHIPAPHSASPHDSVSNSLIELTAPSMQQLLQVVENRLFPAGAHQAESIHTPGHSSIDSLYPGQSSIALDAKDVAEKSIAKAAHVIEMAGVHNEPVPGYPDPRAVIELANQFIATGQLPNYLRATELGRVVVSWYDGPLPGPSRTRAKATIVYLTIRKLWRRAPLLVILLGWLLSGAAIGLFLKVSNVPANKTVFSFNIWAIGFLALVVFQFVSTIRGALHRK
jgi:hypothetical protein